jgi:uncharacterized protein
LQSRRRRPAVSPHQTTDGGQTKLVADAMLGSLARKLRAFGFDTSYFREGDDSSLVRLAADEDRIILTSDLALAERCASRGIPCLSVRGRTDGARLSSVSSGALSAGIILARGPRRCSVCNGVLHKVERSQMVGLVSSKVVKRHRLFQRCLDCGQVYWRGSHWKKLRWLETQLVRNQVATSS